MAKFASFGIMASLASALISHPPASKASELVYIDSVAKNQVVTLQTAGSPGTAVIIGRKGNQYLALTSAHVIAGTKPAEEKSVVSLKSGKSFPVTKSMKLKDGIDVAAVVFSADEEFNIAVIDAIGKLSFDCSDSAEERKEYYGELVSDWDACYHSTQTVGVSAPTGAVTVPLLRTTKHTRMMPRARGNRDGYEYMYEASTVPGMSGGGVFAYRSYCGQDAVKQTGNVSLLAIHGRSEDYVSGGRSGISLAVPLDLLVNQIQSLSGAYGVPVTKDQIRLVVSTQYCK